MLESNPTQNPAMARAHYVGLVRSLHSGSAQAPAFYGYDATCRRAPTGASDYTWARMPASWRDAPSQRLRQEQFT